MVKNKMTQQQQHQRSQCSEVSAKISVKSVLLKSESLQSLSRRNKCFVVNFKGFDQSRLAREERVIDAHLLNQKVFFVRSDTSDLAEVMDLVKDFVCIFASDKSAEEIFSILRKRRFDQTVFLIDVAENVKRKLAHVRDYFCSCSLEKKDETNEKKSNLTSVEDGYRRRESSSDICQSNSFSAVVVSVKKDLYTLKWVEKMFSRIFC